METPEIVIENDDDGNIKLERSPEAKIENPFKDNLANSANLPIT